MDSGRMMAGDRGVLIQLAAHENMTPEQALSLCLREAQRDEITDVVVISTTDEGKTRIRSSNMTRATANWMIDQAKLHTLLSDLEE